MVNVVPVCTHTKYRLPNPAYGTLLQQQDLKKKNPHVFSSFFSS